MIRATKTRHDIRLVCDQYWLLWCQIHQNRYSQKHIWWINGNFAIVQFIWDTLYFIGFNRPIEEKNLRPVSQSFPRIFFPRFCFSLTAWIILCTINQPIGRLNGFALLSIIASNLLVCKSSVTKTKTPIKSPLPKWF